MFSLDANGAIYSRKIFCESIIETKIFRLTQYNGFPIYGQPGEIVYGVNTNTNTLDFWGYIAGIGWKSLTGDINIGSPSPYPIFDISWSGAVLDIVTEPPVSPERYGRYLINWTENTTGLFATYEGYIAEYNFDTFTWNFIKPDDGTYIINESIGNKTMVANVSGNVIYWVTETTSATIGPDENGNLVYTYGKYSDLTSDTPVGTVIDRFNKDLLRIYNDSILSFKHIMGRSHTNPDFKDYNETINAKFNIGADSIFVDDIPNDASQSIIGDIPIAILVDAVLVPISGSNNHAFRATWPNPLPNNAPDDAISGQPIKNSISPAYGDNYRALLFSGSTPIYNTDARIWSFQYNSGVLFQTNTNDVNPTIIRIYVYIGEMLSQSLVNSLKLATNDKNLHVPNDIISDNVNSTLFLTDTPRKNSSIMAYVNGIYVNIGNGTKLKDSYFSSDNGVTAKTFSNISLGDLWFWNSSISGYKLEPSDDISFQYLSPSNINNVPETSVGQSGLFVVGAGVSLLAGDFVNIYNNAGIPTIRNSEYTTGLQAHGYVIEDASEGQIKTVFFGGINPNFMDIGSPSGVVGDSVYLYTNGTVTTSPVDNISGSCIQYLGYIVNESSIYVDIQEPIFIN